jgi:hypothetical protein
MSGSSSPSAARKRGSTPTRSRRPVAHRSSSLIVLSSPPFEAARWRSLSSSRGRALEPRLRRALGRAEHARDAGPERDLRQCRGDILARGLGLVTRVGRVRRRALRHASERLSTSSPPTRRRRACPAGAGAAARRYPSRSEASTSGAGATCDVIPQRCHAPRPRRPLHLRRRNTASAIVTLAGSRGGSAWPGHPWWARWAAHASVCAGAVEHILATNAP